MADINLKYFTIWLLPMSEMMTKPDYPYNEGNITQMEYERDKKYSIFTAISVNYHE